MVRRAFFAAAALGSVAALCIALPVLFAPDVPEMAIISLAEAPSADEGPPANLPPPIAGEVRGGAASIDRRAVTRPEHQGAALITGRVEYADGRPGAQLAIEARFAPLSGSPLAVSAPVLKSRSGKDGYFQLDRLADGIYAIRVDDGSLSGSERLYIQRGVNANAVIVLRESGTISGRIFDSDGRPVARAAVAPVLAGDFTAQWRAPIEALAAITDEEGRFSLHGVPAEPVMLYAQAPGGGSVLSQPVTPDAANLELIVDGGGRLAGQTVDVASQEPAGGVRVVARARDIDSPVMEAISDESGAFRFEGLRPAQYTLGIDDPVFVLAERVGPVAVETGGESVATLQVSSGGAIAGHLRTATYARLAATGSRRA